MALAGTGAGLVASQETTSLVKRLAGPSTGKAGLAKDQTEINRIIAEASKGSKFYENEKRKDKDLTERIKRILEQLDDAIVGVDMESQRDLSQTIIHVDMDAFFAAKLLHNPDLRGKPFGASRAGCLSDVGYGVLTTASYEARKYGVRSGMPGFIAKKLCPQLIFVANTFSRYSKMSNRVMAIFKRYDPNMSPAGCDEGYLNITPYCKAHNLTAEDCVQDMRMTVYNETGLTVSAGIAPNKTQNKPNGQFYLSFDKQSITTFMHDLSIRKIPGIGRVNERLLEAIGIKTCGDIYTHRAIISLMDKEFGLRFLIRTYLGISSNVVQPHRREERKSIGAERTFSPLSDPTQIFLRLDEIVTELENDMEQNGWAGRTITLKYKLDTYQVFTRAKSFDRWITKKEDLYITGKELIQPEFPLTIRLIGLRVTKLKDLKAPSVPTNGIKRFFESFKNESSRKRPKLDEEEIEFDPSNVFDSSSGRNNERGSDLEDEMPGFHEQDERDYSPHNEYRDTTFESTETPRPRPPISAPAHSSPKVSNPGIFAATSLKIQRRRFSDQSCPPSTMNVGSFGNTAFESLECPICGTTLQTNNQGLNSHIDFCLSRGAIRQAHAEASSLVGESSTTSWQWSKLNQGAQTTINRSKKRRKQNSK
ncbi:hypothetical protein BDZ94DRAFT_1284217 [Collybia nuda]|uniref:DNA polymerase kappa n=1 Tax=Collybia nuda TaxID=64659 RepID=A0A9P5XZX8_9AGAR|nr:hypothetical protein BDZ94DRAFT_1284217 [Collybia nuda]